MCCHQNKQLTANKTRFLYGRVSYVTLLYPFPASQAIRVSKNDISTTLIVSFVLSFTQSLMNGISYYLTKGTDSYKLCPGTRGDL